MLAILLLPLDFTHSLLMKRPVGCSYSTPLGALSLMLAAMMPEVEMNLKVEVKLWEDNALKRECGLSTVEIRRIEGELTSIYEREDGGNEDDDLVTGVVVPRRIAYLVAVELAPR